MVCDGLGRGEDSTAARSVGVGLSWEAVGSEVPLVSGLGAGGGVTMKSGSGGTSVRVGEGDGTAFFVFLQNVSE